MSIDAVRDLIGHLFSFIDGALASEKDENTIMVYDRINVKLMNILELCVIEKLEKTNEHTTLNMFGKKVKKNIELLSTKEDEPVLETMSKMNLSDSTNKRSTEELIFLQISQPALEDIINEIPADRTKSRIKILQSLNKDGITTLDQLLESNSDYLRSIKGIGPKRLAQLIEALKVNGYKLND